MIKQKERMDRVGDQSSEGEVSPVDMFLYYSGTYAHVNAIDVDPWEEAFAEAVNKSRDQEGKSLFKRGFAMAVVGRAVSSQEYEAETGWGFDTEEEYRGHLRHLWGIFYGGEDPEVCARD